VTTERVSNHCPLCDGRLVKGRATIPFVRGDSEDKSVVIIKNAPAYTCEQCNYQEVVHPVARNIRHLLREARALGLEVAIVEYCHVVKVQPGG
jgi:YgiT-type zinc finger domain-containing protein